MRCGSGGRCGSGAVEELAGDLPDGAGAHDDQEVAGSADDLELFDDGLEGVEVHGLDAALAEAVDEVGGGDLGFFDLGVADEVDVWDDDDIGVGEGLGEFFEQESCA